MQRIPDKLARHDATGQLRRTAAEKLAEPPSFDIDATVAYLARVVIKARRIVSATKFLIPVGAFGAIAAAIGIGLGGGYGYFVGELFVFLLLLITMFGSWRLLKLRTSADALLDLVARLPEAASSTLANPRQLAIDGLETVMMSGAARFKIFRWAQTFRTPRDPVAEVKREVAHAVASTMRPFTFVAGAASALAMLLMFALGLMIFVIGAAIGLFF